MPQASVAIRQGNVMSACGCNESARADQLYRERKSRQDELVAQGVADHLLRREIKERKAAIDAELEQIRGKMWQAYDKCNQEFCKQERYCKGQRDEARAPWKT